MAINKVFIDTNILLDFLLAREGELDEIEQLFNLNSKRLFECYISESVISTSLYFLEKEKVKSFNMLRDICEVLKIVPFHPDVLNADIEIFKDLEDNLLYFLAQHHKMDFFITRNIKDYKKAQPSLPVLTPKQFIKHLQPNDLPK